MDDEQPIAGTALRGPGADGGCARGTLTIKYRCPNLSSETHSPLLASPHPSPPRDRLMWPQRVRSTAAAVFTFPLNLRLIFSLAFSAGTALRGPGADGDCARGTECARVPGGVPHETHATLDADSFQTHETHETRETHATDF